MTHRIACLAPVFAFALSSISAAAIVSPNRTWAYGTTDGSGEPTEGSVTAYPSETYIDFNVQTPDGYGSGSVNWEASSNHITVGASVNTEHGPNGSVGVIGESLATFQVDTPSTYSLSLPAIWGRSGNSNSAFTYTRVGALFEDPNDPIAGFNLPSGGNGSDGEDLTYDPPYTGTLQTGITYSLYVVAVSTASDGSGFAGVSAQLDVTPITFASAASFESKASPVPEPSFALLALGALGLLRRRATV